MSVNRFVGGRGRDYKTMVECTWEMQVYRGLESLGNKTWWSGVHVQLGRVGNSRSMGGGVDLSCY